jgi:predicted PurR-regulated permease PerM
MKELIELSMAPEALESSAGTIKVTNKAAPSGERLPAPPSPPEAAKSTPLQFVLVALGVVAFLYFARPVVLPIVLACVGGMTLKPLIRWLSQCHIPPALSAAVVLLLLVASVTIGFIRVSYPALTWLSEALQHMTA